VRAGGCGHEIRIPSGTDTTEPMIDGLIIQVSSAEIEEHLRERASHHQERRMFYERQVASLKEGGLRAQRVSNDPVGSLQESAHRHGEREAFLRFMAEHIVPDETYRLSEQDLIRIEIVSRYL
jgi:hypothetical protein